MAFLDDLTSLFSGGAGIYGALQGMVNASQLQDLSGSAIPYAQQILQTGFDPQSQLYNRTAGQVSDQSNAINAMSGVAGTPYGAGLSDMNMRNFNIDWQNNLLNRERTAASGFGSLAGSIGNLSDSAYQQNTGYGKALGAGAGSAISGIGGLFSDFGSLF